MHEKHRSPDSFVPLNPANSDSSRHGIPVLDLGSYSKTRLSRSQLGLTVDFCSCCHSSTLPVLSVLYPPPPLPHGLTPPCTATASQDAPLSSTPATGEAAGEGDRYGVRYGYSSLDGPRNDAEDGSIKSVGERKAGGRHDYAPVVLDADGCHRGGGGGVCLTSRFHVAIPISYFCVGFLSRYV